MDCVTQGAQVAQALSILRYLGELDQFTHKFDLEFVVFCVIQQGDIKNTGVCAGEYLFWVILYSSGNT